MTIGIEPTSITRRHARRRTALGAITAMLCGLGVASSAGATQPPQTSPPSDTSVEIVEPDPLPDETVVRVNSQLRGDGTSDLWLADLMGEFAKENIVIEFSQLPSTDAFGPLAQGDLDVLATGLSAAFLNSVDAGFNTRVVFPFFDDQGENREGLWIRNELAADAPASLDGASMGSTSGVGSPVSLAVYQYLQEAGLTWDDIEIVTFPAPELALALENGAVDFAWILSPFWTQVADGGYAEFVQGSLPGFHPGGYLFGDNLLNENREVGEAFIRALVRTRQTYLQGDYKSDPTTAESLAEALDVDIEIVQATPSVVWNTQPNLDWDDQIVELQEVWLEAGDILNFDEPIAADQLIDRSFIEAVTG